MVFPFLRAARPARLGLLEVVVCLYPLRVWRIRRTQARFFQDSARDGRRHSDSVEPRGAGRVKGEPEISPSYGRHGVRGFPGESFLFTVNYTDMDNDAPSEVVVVIDQKEYSMKEVDPDDQDYASGKDYFFSLQLKEGNYVVFFRATDANGNTTTTDAKTVSASRTTGHLDLIFWAEDDVFPLLTIVIAVFFLFLVAILLVGIMLVLQLRKFSKRYQNQENVGEEE